jgi:hypothetical protein
MLLLIGYISRLLGIRKTLIAELLAEYFYRVLILVSASEFSIIVEAIKERLPRIFKYASR